jgi:hypothetical protein
MNQQNLLGLAYPAAESKRADTELRMGRAGERFQVVTGFPPLVGDYLVEFRDNALLLVGLKLGVFAFCGFG